MICFFLNVIKSGFDSLDKCSLMLKTTHNTLTFNLTFSNRFAVSHTEGTCNNQIT